MFSKRRNIDVALFASLEYVWGVHQFKSHEPLPFIQIEITYAKKVRSTNYLFTNPLGTKFVSTIILRILEYDMWHQLDSPNVILSHNMEPISMWKLNPCVITITLTKIANYTCKLHTKETEYGAEH